jgi:hypothetical protein
VAGRRRSRGEGSIYRRKDGRWVGQYEVNDKHQYVYGKTRAEVAAKLAKVIAQRNAGFVFDCECLILAQLDEDQSAALVLKMHSTLSKSLRQAVRWRLIPLNVCVAVMPPRPLKPEIRPLDTR